jgi:hypothetical protein
MTRADGRACFSTSDGSVQERQTYESVAVLPRNSASAGLDRITDGRDEARGLVVYKEALDKIK